MPARSVQSGCSLDCPGRLRPLSKLRPARQGGITSDNIQLSEPTSLGNGGHSSALFRWRALSRCVALLWSALRRPSRTAPAGQC